MKTQWLPDFPGKRTLKITLRSLHLVCIALLTGSAMLTQTDTSGHLFWAAAVLSGILLMAMDVLSNLIWLIQVRGIIIMLKLLLLVLAISTPDWTLEILLFVIFVSGIISHAPSDWRYYSLYHRKVIRSANDTKG